MTEFPISGVETYWWLPPIVAFAISCLTATGGLSGAFLILPFQVSLLGFTGPAVSPTNLLFNVVAIPGGVYRYYREKRLVWPLAAAIVIGTLPGMFLGAIIRVTYLPDPRSFKPFVGFVLTYVGFRLVKDIFVRRPRSKMMSSTPGTFIVTSAALTLKSLGYDFQGKRYHSPTVGVLVLSMFVGIIGGAYGIGGGAIIAPFLVTVFGLPVYTVAGATLLGTLVSSIFGVMFYVLIAKLNIAPQLSTSPDWLLGVLFGIGGFAGVYVGARLQKFVPARIIKGFLALCVLGIAVAYLSQLLP